MNTGTALTAAGRPRDKAATERVVEAALRLFGTAGFAGVTMAEVAREAGVGLDTIYRRWPSKQVLVVHLMASAVESDVQLPDTGDVREDLLGITMALVTAVRGPLGPVLAAAIGEAGRDPQLLARVAEAMEQRRTATRVLLQRAVERGQLPADADVDLVLDLLSGLVWHRAFVGDTDLSEGAVRRAVDLVLAGAGLRP